MASTTAGAPAPASGEAGDGPVMSLMNKRLRALRKKYNRILQTEEAVNQGKTHNKEQEDLLRSKLSVTVLIDEYDKLRLPLSAAVADEIAAAVSASARPSPPSDSAPPYDSGSDGVEDLLRLLYFGSLFDVRPGIEYSSVMMARTHERECCLTYDYVTDEATDLLGERDLDSISAIGALLTSRQPYSNQSHKDALHNCVEHARRWLSKSGEPVLPGADVTYARLRARLNKILSSDYFTTAPEIKATDYAAVSAGHSVGHAAVPDHEGPQSNVQEGEGDVYYDHKAEEATEFEGTEPSAEQSTVEVAPNLEQSEEDQVAQDDLYKQQQGDTNNVNENGFAETRGYHQRRGGYYSQRGGGRGNGSGRRGGGYPNGRGGGRGGRGNYQNGRNQSQEYYPRSSYNPRGRGGRSGAAGMYSNQGGPNYGGEVIENRA